MYFVLGCDRYILQFYLVYNEDDCYILRKYLQIAFSFRIYYIYTKLNVVYVVRKRSELTRIFDRK